MNEFPDWDEVFTSAALDPTHWLDALRQLAEATGSSSGQLLGLGPLRANPFNLVSNFSPENISRSLTCGADKPEENFRIAAANAQIARGQYDQVLHEADYDAAVPHLRTRGYVDFCAEVDIPFGCQTNLVVDEHGLIGLAILRSQREGRSTREQRRVFAHASQAARRAVRLQERLENQQAKMLAGAFEAMTITAFVLNSQGKVTALTSGAEELVREGAIRLSGGQVDAAAQPLSLSQCIAALVAPNGIANVRCRIERPNGLPPLFFEGFRLPHYPWQFGQPPHAVLLSRKRSGDRAGISGLLSALYGLTTTEATIALRLLNGHSRTDIAASRGVSTDTLRGQIKTLLAKTDCANEAALMRLLAAITD
ncbi:hypothetical protein D2V17_11915 [Aurantiacibacter xanthus]|uniref:HTH luxR-type domain-containing protein n=1 Tax=Aurantiacibacter xanthus TaxID=1784712 RepID=A0A3A1P7K7_9SPHN|nr:hypothetical protein [Aurantiacibacter xanthus]RIV84120.1 hypothetical protein D2V17_11915 [Aurantiacibacter xanthus]